MLAMKKFVTAILAFVILGSLVGAADAQFRLFGKKSAKPTAQQKSARNEPCDSNVGVPLKPLSPLPEEMVIAIPTNNKQQSCKSKNCRTQGNHIHIHLTQEQVRQLLEKTQQTQQQATPAGQVAAQATGTFVAPPATGVVTEESVSRGWRGAVIRFPEIRIGLPSIELPSRYKIRHPRKMFVDSSEAAYVERTQQVQQQNRQIVAAQAIAPQHQMVVAVPPQAQRQDVSVTMRQIQEVERMKEQLSEKEKLLERKLRECEQLLQQYRGQQQSGIQNSSNNTHHQFQNIAVDPQLDATPIIDPER